MNRSRRVFFFTLLFIAILFLGYYRDFVFKNINALLKARDFEMTYSMPPSLSFFEDFSYKTILDIKWLLTLVFGLLYLIVSVTCIKFLFNNKKFILITIAAYIIITIVSGMLISLGHWIPGISDKMYLFSRYLMGMAQSPIILMILIPAFKLSEKENLKI